MEICEEMDEGTKDSKKSETKTKEVSGFSQEAPPMPKAASGCKDMVMEPKETSLDAGSKISNALGKFWCIVFQWISNEKRAKRVFELRNE